MYNMAYKTGVGDMAPDFTLPSTSGSEVRLYDCKNKKTVLLFFFDHQDPRCLDRLAALASDYRRFTDENVILFPVAILSPVEGEEIVDERKLPFAILCDGDHTVAWMYNVAQCSSEPQHVCFEIITHISRPQIIIIDMSGIIRYKHGLYEPGARVDNDVLRAECAQALR